MSNNIFSQFMTVFGFLMVACYIGIAAYLFFSPSFSHIDVNMRMIFSLFFLVYGLYRLVRLVNKIRNKNNDEN